jgi:hypothetical protein
MKAFLKKQVLTISGIVLGGIGGYVYYLYYGCSRGCPIISNPLNTVLYGMLTGGLLFSSIKINSKKERK